MSVAKNYRAILEGWQALPVEAVTARGVLQDEMFQPRNPRLLKFRERPKAEEQSAEHVARMQAALVASKRTELDPILVARINGGLLFVVDGHHRLEASRKARRKTILARVLDTDQHTAAMVSKLVNLDARALPMHAEQAREMAWQYIAEVTAGGLLPLPPGESTRTLAGTFGISPDTAHRMVLKCPEVRPEEYSPEACDPATGWPRWKYVRSYAWKGLKEQLTEEQEMDLKTGKALKALVRLLDWYGDEAVGRAYKALAEETQSEALEAESVRF